MQICILAGELGTALGVAFNAPFNAPFLLNVKELVASFHIAAIER